MIPPRARLTDAVVWRHDDPVERHLVLRVRGKRELLAQRDTRGSGINQEQVDPVLRAGEDNKALGGSGEGHVALHAAQSERAPSGSASISTPLALNPLSGSSHAGVSTDSPEAIRRSHLSFWASSPAATSAPPLKTALTK